MKLKSLRIEKNPQRPLSSVPTSIIILFILFIILQVTFSIQQENNPDKIPAMPPALSLNMANIFSLGDPLFFQRVGLLWLQQYDRQNGESLSYHDLDYYKIKDWLTLFSDLHPSSEYPFTLAVRGYAVVNDNKKRKLMFDWVEEKFPASPLTRWRWLAESIVITKHALNNAEDAKRMADLLYIHAQNLDIPFWAKDLKIILMEDLNQTESLKIFIAGLIESGVITDERERGYLIRKFEALDEKNKNEQNKPAAENSSPVLNSQQ